MLIRNVLLNLLSSPPSFLPLPSSFFVLQGNAGRELGNATTVEYTDQCNKIYVYF